MEGVRAGVPGHQFALRAMRRMNIRYEERQPMDPQVKAQVKEMARPHVDALSQLLERDLTHWVS